MGRLKLFNFARIAASSYPLPLGLAVLGDGQYGDFATNRDIKKKLGLKSINSVISYLIKDYKMRRLNSIFGVDRGKISSFTEEDRIEDRR